MVYAFGPLRLSVAFVEAQTVTCQGPRAAAKITAIVLIETPVLILYFFC